MKLYAVGDDWQSIFRFTGSDISIITDFRRYFGATHQTAILHTYRFNTQIAAVSGKFIQRNPKQLRKEIKAAKQAQSESFVFMGIHAPGDKLSAQIKKDAKIRSVLDEVLALKADARVFFIGRYHHNQPLKLANYQSRYPGLKMEYHTAHRVKGMTCDYAILLDVDSGEIGFPSEIADDPLLNFLLNGEDDYEHAEERRLFYVAITRAKHRNYILYDWRNPSRFVGELIEINGGAGSDKNWQ